MGLDAFFYLCNSSPMKTLDPVAPVLAAVERYLKKSGMTESGFGRAVAKNSTLLARIRNGNATLKSLRQVIAFMERKHG